MGVWPEQAWGDYRTNVIDYDYDYLNKLNVIDYDYDYLNKL